MVNSDYCLLLGDFAPMASVSTGGDVASQHIGALVDSLAARVLGMPLELQ
jgi:hypothetical protein